MNLTLKGLRVDAGSGPGSRGGHIVGHTSSGKPIYALHGHPAHKDFSAMDHYEAGHKHSEEATRMFEENGKLSGDLKNFKTKKKSQETLGKIRMNREAQDAHNNQGQKHFGSWVGKGGLKVTHPEEAE